MAFGTADRLKSGRGRGRGARARPPGHAARGPRRADRRSAPAAPRLCRRAARSPAIVGAAPRARPRAWRPTAAATAHALAEALRARRARRAPARARGDRLRLPRPGRLAAPAGLAARAPLGAGDRGRATRARRSCPPSGAWRVVDPETGERIEVDTSRRGASASASPRSRPSGRDAGRARAAPACASTTSSLSTEGDWLRELGRRLR